MNYIFSVSTIFMIFVFKCSGSEIDDKNVLVLTKENFDSVLNDNEFVVVEFYAPSCGACVAFAPEYSKAADLVLEKEAPIKITKIDAMEETEIAKKYGIDGYPTVRFFRRNSTPLDYKGLRLAENLVSWAIKRTGPPAVQLNTIEEAENLIATNNVVTIGFFSHKTDEAVAIFLSVADASEDSVFGVTFSKDILENFNAKAGSIVLFNKEYENEEVFSKEYTKNEIAKFVEIGSLPLVMEFKTDNAAHVFGGYIKSHLLLFMSKSNPNTQPQLEDIKVVAKEFKGDVLFTYFDADSSEYDGFFDFLGITKDSIPQMRIFHFGKQLEKYKPENSKLTEANIREFVKDYLNGKLEKNLRSEVLPEDWNSNAVYVLVGDNFESVVMDSTKDVLVLFYAPWCHFCKEFAPIYETIGKHYESRDDVLIVKVDASKNEFKNKVIRNLPTITLYTKANSIIDYTGKQTLENLVEFVESGGVQEEVQESEENDSSVPVKEEL